MEVLKNIYVDFYIVSTVRIVNSELWIQNVVYVHFYNESIVKIVNSDLRKLWMISEQH